MKKLFSEFKDFAIQGNMVDMSVGIVIGAAFTALVKDGLVGCIITPLINYIISLFTTTDGASLDNLAGQIGPFPVGALIGTIINFIITALVLFIIVKIINGLRKPAVEAPVTTKKCPYCKSDVDIEAVKCPHCTSDI